MTTETPAADVVELKPCPFCGSKAERYTIGEEEPTNTGGDVIVCTRCQASSHVEFGRKENLESRWNTRATDAEITRLRAENAELRVKAETYDQMTSTAVELGYPSILEALEDVDELQRKLDEAVERSYRAGHRDGRCGGSFIDEGPDYQRYLTSIRGEPQP